MAQMSKTKKPAGAFRTVRRMDTSTAGTSQKKLTPRTQLNLQPGLTKAFKSDPERTPRVASARNSRPKFYPDDIQYETGREKRGRRTGK